MKTYQKIIAGGALLLTLASVGRLSCSASEYADYSWPFTEKTEMGRTKNAISAVIAGAVAKKIHQYPLSKIDIDLEIEKSWWPDAHIKGEIDTKYVSTSIDDLTFTSVKYVASKNKNGKFEGTVKKSELDWDVTEDSLESGSYHIGRKLLKFDADLKIVAKYGKITGEYFRHGPSWNWGINGFYDSEGNVRIDVNVPVGLDFSLYGKITPHMTKF